MKIKPGTALNVVLAFQNGAEEIPVGRLALDRGIAVLEYARDFAASGLTVNPLFAAPSTTLVRAKEPRIFGGLHGVFSDSLPDAWGELLVRRRAEANGIPYSSLTALDKLAIVGNRGMGALTYQPAIPHHVESDALDLDRLANASLSILQGASSDVLAQMEELGGSSGGARPKALVGINDAGEIVAGAEHLPSGFDAWIVKFRDARDVEDIGPLEAAYAAMAHAAGVEMSETKLLPSRSGAGYFATRRFDRGEGGSRLHAASAAGLLDIDWAVPALDYNALLKLTMAVTRHHADVEKLFRRMVFNVVACNRDDHAKQHAFLMDATGAWRLAPAYDLTFSRGPGGEHYLAVNGKGADISRADATTLGLQQGIAQKRIDDIVEQTVEAVSGFSRFAKTFGVRAQTLRDVRQELDSQLTLFAASRRG